MKTLITGGAGFIGSHLAEKLLSDGHEVIIIDDLSTGSMSNIAHIADSDRVQFVLGDVRNAGTMNVLVEKCDMVFHMAAAVGVQLIVDEPVRTIETNIHGTEVVLEMANKYRKKIVLASTSEVYGKSEKIPFQEDDDTVLGSTRFSRWSYACSKAIDEFLGIAYYNQYQLPVIVVRLFNTVGPRQTGQYGMVIPRFVEHALQGKPITIYGTGQQARCFGYVGDAVEAIKRLAYSDSAAGRIYNIGSTNEISIEGLADLIIKKTGSTAGKEFISYQQAYGKDFDDMMRRVPCVERLREQINFVPETKLDDILDFVIDEKSKIIR